LKLVLCGAANAHAGDRCRIVSRREFSVHQYLETKVIDGYARA
jgi:hypothetical protein